VGRILGGRVRRAVIAGVVNRGPAWTALMIGLGLGALALPAAILRFVDWWSELVDRVAARLRRGGTGV
jgi:hypothetical protein